MTERPRERPQLDADEAEALQAIGWRQTSGESTCPDSSMLLAAEDGTLDEATAARVTAHVTSCATCQLLARDLTLVFADGPTDAERARIDRRITAGRTTRRATPYIWAGAGALALAAGLVWFLVMSRPLPPPEPETQIARGTLPPLPSVFIVDRPLLPLGDVDLAVRGDASKPSLENQIAAALDRADAGDVSTALSELDAIVRENQRSEIAAIALGAVLLRADRNAEAVTSLERADHLRPGPGTRDEREWFQSIAFLRTGNPDRAKTLLGGLCQRGGARSARACAGLAELNRAPSSR